MMLLTLCLSSLLIFVRADNSVHTLSKYGNGQLITSSILNWIPDTHYSASKTFVIGGFEIVENTSGDTSDAPEPIKRPIFVCRAEHNGIWVSGGQREGEKKCTVTLTGNVNSYDRYQLLENVDGAARISWNDWKKYYQPSVGTVSTDKLYVARHVADEKSNDGMKPKQTHYIGTLNAQDSMGTITYVKEDGKEGSAEEGQLLVEQEPIAYELINVKLNFNKASETKRTPRELGRAIIRNTGDSPAKLADAISYSYMYKLYWGQGHAMFTGLNTSITLQNNTRLPDIKWGIVITENRTNVHSVEVYLEPGTAVNVTLRGNYTDIEVPYSGKLISFYEDGDFNNHRMINGMRREESIIDVAPEFGPIYYLNNYTLVPTTVPPPTTESITTTTVPTTTSASTRQQEHQKQQTDRFDLSDAATEEQYNKELDENSILHSAAQPDTTGMQGDDGGPLSLKNKAEGSQNAATCVERSSIVALVATTMSLILHLAT